jgi:ubiquinone/menaquinone biosynthesis C-methylase UbiE
MSSFIDPAKIIAQSGILQGQTVADLGCGGGFYSVAAAKAVGNLGVVYAVDIQESKLAATQSAGRHLGFNNIMAIKADLEKTVEDIAENSCDAVLATSIIHEVGSKEALVKNAYRLLRTGGGLVVVEWKKEAAMFGPALESRIDQKDLEQLLVRLGFKKTKDLPPEKFHYAMVFSK